MELTRKQIEEIVSCLSTVIDTSNSTYSTEINYEKLEDLGYTIMEEAEENCRTCKYSRRYNDATIDCDFVVGRCVEYHKWEEK